MEFKLEITAKNMDVTDRIREYIEKKAPKLGRLLSDVEHVRFDLANKKSARSAADRQVAQITVYGKGYTLRTEERAEEIFTAIDVALEKMQRQAERLKGKRDKGRGDGTSAAEVAAEPVEVDETAESEPIIVRRKRFHLAPMDEMEAIEQMLLLGHENFFVFYNAQTNAINVLYHRRDGTYGLIEPEIG